MSRMIAPSIHFERALRVALVGVFITTTGLLACEAETPHTEANTSPSNGELEVVVEGDRESVGLAVLDGTTEVRAAMATGVLSFEPRDRNRFLRVGLRWDALQDVGLEYRVRDTAWSDWQPVAVIWNEDIAYNGHIVLDAMAGQLELRASSGEEDALQFMLVEFYDKPVVAERGNRNEAEDSQYRTLEQGLAPPNIVNLRAAWGASPPACNGSDHTPQYLTIHHTVTPTVDSMTPEQRLRQIQAFHQGTRMWCDIGYHFLVSADGRLWQGRDTHDRTGAHVGGSNANNVGISFMGSFHIDQVPQAMINGVPPLMAWFRDNYNITLDRTHVLGHREWPGQSTSCPGEFLLPRLEEMIMLASNGNVDESVTIETAWQSIAGQDRDFVATGSSASIFDTLPGQQTVGTLTVRNGADRPATDDVILGYWFETPFVEPLSYTIETDRPAKDGVTFVASSFTHPENTPSTPGAEGFVHVGVLEAGESVRVVFAAQSTQYSFGASDHPDLRGWVKHIGSYYGEQNGWDDAVETNVPGVLLRDFAQVDVFAADEWQFDGSDGADVEGWRTTRDVSELAVNTTDGALAVRADGPDPSITSPDWTAIDADTQKTIVLRARQHGAEAREGRIYWVRDGEGYDDARSVRFTHPGGGEMQMFELDLSTHPDWSGTVVRLRVEPWTGGPFTAAEAWFDMDYLMVAAGTTNPPVDADNDGVGADVDCDDNDPNRYPGAAEVCDNVDNNCDGRVDEGVCDGTPLDTGDMGDTASAQLDGSGRTSDACGCRTRSTPTRSAPLGVLWLVGVGLFVAVRRRRK